MGWHARALKVVCLFQSHQELPKNDELGVEIGTAQQATTTVAGTSTSATSVQPWKSIDPKP